MKSAATIGTLFAALLTFVILTCAELVKCAGRAAQYVAVLQVFLERGGAVPVRNARHHEWVTKCIPGLWNC